MARNTDEVSIKESCPMCFEDYHVEGIKLPRQLLCEHTLCSDCIPMLAGCNETGMFRCPVCKAPHCMSAGVEPFPVDNRLLTHTNECSNTEMHLLLDEIECTEACTKHGERLDHFCNEATCQERICSECLTSGHNGHEVVEFPSLMRESYETLRRNLGHLHRTLITDREQLYYLYKSSCSDHVYSQYMAKVTQISRVSELKKGITKQLNYQEILTLGRDVREMASTWNIPLSIDVEKHSHHDKDSDYQEEETEYLSPLQCKTFKGEPGTQFAYQGDIHQDQPKKEVLGLSDTEDMSQSVEAYQTPDAKHREFLSPNQGIENDHSGENELQITPRQIDPRKCGRISQNEDTEDRHPDETDDVYSPMETLQIAETRSRDSGYNSKDYGDSDDMHYKMVEENEDSYLPMNITRASVVTKRERPRNSEWRNRNRKLFLVDVESEDFSLPSDYEEPRPIKYGNVNSTSPSQEQQSSESFDTALGDSETTLQRSNTDASNFDDDNIYEEVDPNFICSNIKSSSHENADIYEKVDAKLPCSSGDTSVPEHSSIYEDVEIENASTERIREGIEFASRERKKSWNLEINRNVNFPSTPSSYSSTQETLSAVSPSDASHSFSCASPDGVTSAGTIDSQSATEYQNFDVVGEEDDDESCDHVYATIDQVYDVEEEKEKLLALKEKSDHKFLTFQAEIKEDKEKVLKNLTDIVNELYDKLEKDVTDMKEKVATNIDKHINFLKSNHEGPDEKEIVLIEENLKKDLDSVKETINQRVNEIHLIFSKENTLKSVQM